MCFLFICWLNYNRRYNRSMNYSVYLLDGSTKITCFHLYNVFNIHSISYYLLAHGLKEYNSSFYNNLPNNHEILSESKIMHDLFLILIFFLIFLIFVLAILVKLDRNIDEIFGCYVSPNYLGIFTPLKYKFIINKSIRKL